MVSYALSYTTSGRLTAEVHGGDASDSASDQGPGSSSNNARALQGNDEGS